MKKLLIFLILGIIMINCVSSYNYINSSNGFKLATYGIGDPKGIAYNGSDYWILDGQDSFVYHINSGLVNQSDGFKTTVGISTAPENMCMKNSTTLWITTNSGGTARATQMDLDGTNGTASINLNAAGILNGNVPCTSNDSDLWVTDNSDLWTYHFDKNLNNVTGFSLSGMNNPSGITMVSNNNFYIGDAGTDFMNHYINGINQTDGFSIADFGIAEIRSIAKNNYDLLVIDNQDIAVYYLQASATITLNYPTDDFVNFASNITFSCSASGTAIYNISLFHNISGTWQRNKTIDYSLTTPPTQTSLFNVTNIPNGNNFGWTCEAIDSSNGGTSFITSFSSTNYTFNVSNHLQNSISYNTTAYETDDNLITINVSTNGTIPTAKLFYNGTNKGSATVTTYGGNSFIINKSINVPLGQGNTTFYFEINVGGSIANTTFYQQTIYPIYLAQCNSTLTIPYVNFTFKDEENSSKIGVSIPYSYFEYYLGSNASNNKTLTYVNNTENTNYTFCFSPQNKTANVNTYLQYTRANYYQRTYNPAVLQFSNKTNETILYSILQSSSDEVTFLVVNSIGDPISGVAVNVTRLIGSTLVLIGDGITDAAGAVTFYLSPNSIYNYVFYKAGYDLYTLSNMPTTPPYTITLGGTSSSTIITKKDYAQGMQYWIRPSSYNYLENGTDYNFNFTLISSYYDVDNFGFYLKLPNGSILQSTSASSNGGIVNVNQNTGNFEKIIINAYWVVEGNYTNVTSYWIMYDPSGSSHSLSNFFSRLTNYSSNGMFGMDVDERGYSFALNLIIFVSMFMFVGIMAYKFGITNVGTLSLIIFCLVAIVDLQMGLIPSPIGAIPHFPTMIVGFISIILVFREVYNQ